ncbi:MAG: hypothetical protein CL762_03980 [Chloroflexi bacterium]|nr:hypothetical protein [Chloroflexota bacterium]
MWNSQSIKDLRKSLDLSQSAFSKKLGIRQQTVSEWETGVYSPRGGSITLLDMVSKELQGGTSIVHEDYKSSVKTIKRQDKSPVQKKVIEKVNNKRTNFVYYGNVSSSNNGQLLPI